MGGEHNLKIQVMFPMHYSLSGANCSRADMRWSVTRVLQFNWWLQAGSMHEMDHRCCGLQWGAAAWSICAAYTPYIELDAFKETAHLDLRIVKLLYFCMEGETVRCSYMPATIAHSSQFPSTCAMWCHDASFLTHLKTVTDFFPSVLFLLPKLWNPSYCLLNIRAFPFSADLVEQGCG